MTVTIDVLANDSDPDNGLLVIAGVTQPQNGNATIQDQAVVYAPLQDFSGSDFFTYTISDSQGGAASALVSVSVLSDSLASTVWIDAVDGGVVQAGNSTLLVPSGALTQSTFVTISEPIYGMTMQGDGMKMISLEPSGLEFSQPTTLTIYYGETDSDDEDLMEVLAFNETTGEWEPQQITAHDETANTLSVRTDHFSPRILNLFTPLYVAMEIPAHFLPTGAVLTRMTPDNDNCGDDKARFLPGHTGLFWEEGDSGIGRVIESNKFAPAWEGLVSCTQTEDSGVHEITLSRFVDESCGFYMGAGINPAASEDQRESAVVFARLELGSGYLVVGQGNQLANALGYSCYSCVGLVEYAYDLAGSNIVPESAQFPAITPLQMYRRLQPVDEIWAQVGEQIRIPVSGFYSILDWGGYHFMRTPIAPGAVGLPSDSTYLDGIFDWTPKREDGGENFTVQFGLNQIVHDKQRSVTQNLTIHVLPAPNQAPVANNDTATTIVDTPVLVNALTNDSDPDGDPLTIASVSAPAHGSAAVEGQSIRYTPEAGYSGDDSFTYTVSDGSLTSTASVNVTVSAIPPINGNVFVDFGQYTPGMFPDGWSQFGSGQIVPTVEESGGSGPAFHVLDFPEVGWQYWDTFAIYDGIVTTDAYTVQVKLRFLNDVADRAGLTIAWDRSAGTRIDIQPNVYNDDVEFHSSYGGTVNVLEPNIVIDANVDYWLRAVVEHLGENNGKVTVYWSTDGVTFAEILEATGLSNIHGEAGVSTAGPHMPHTQFDDFLIRVGDFGQTWTQLVPMNVPSARTGLEMVYDSFRHVMVAFGGCDGACSDTTWEFDGVNWQPIVTASDPGNRYRPAMAYDPDRRVLVVFGGNDDFGVWHNDTWEYDGVNWVQLQPANSPPARNGASMAYDSVRQRMVLFGGYDYDGGFTFYNDTWEYDGANWVERAPASAPSPRETAGMVFAEHLGKTVMFGGGDSAGSTMHNDTWAWDGENWEQIVTANAPSARWGVNMTYDSTHQKVVLFGGVLGYGTGLNDTWEFDGSNWQQVETFTSPSVRWDIGLAYDAEHNWTVVFGGGNWNGPNFERFADTWVYAPLVAKGLLP